MYFISLRTVISAPWMTLYFPRGNLNFLFTFQDLANNEEAKREHAVNALPPNELVNRLVEKTVPVDDMNPSQSILGN